ncbi:alkaline phosphatase [Marinagarivorans algicola]|uniref:alkaline phosphatase n=1 Tax=Marinagarivorans algicola TaxID=1513270 RepID=UPI003736C794
MKIINRAKKIAFLAIVTSIAGCSDDTKTEYVEVIKEVEVEADTVAGESIVSSIDLGPFKCSAQELSENSEKDCRLYIKGSMNSWSSRPEAQLHYQGDGKYIALFSMQPGSYAFKIADSDWSPERDLAIGKEVSSEVQFDTAMELQRKYDDFENQNMDITVTGDEDQVYRFTLDASQGINTPSLLIENISATDADNLSQPLYLVGTFNNWSHSKDTEFVYKGAGTYEAVVNFLEARTIAFNVHQGDETPLVYGSLDNKHINLQESISALTAFPGGKMSAKVTAGSYVFSVSVLGERQQAIPLSMKKIRAVAGHDTITGVNVATSLTADGSYAAETYHWVAQGDMNVALTNDATQAPATKRQLASAEGVGRYSVTLTTNQETPLAASAGHDVDVIALEKANNIILMIGDGMGYPQIAVTSAYKGEALFLESGKHRGDIKTASADTLGHEDLPEIGAHYYTDSAAAASAMATGRKTNSGTIAQAQPGDGSNLETILEYAQSLGKSVGIVATSHCVHATPASFAAHGPSRNDFAALSASMYGEVKPNVTLCGSKLVDQVDVISTEAEKANYTLVKNKTDLATALTALPATDPKAEILFAGIFGENEIPYVLANENQKSYEAQDIPQLNEMAAAAINILSKNPNGFVLMIEGSQIDFAGHINDTQRVIYETLAFDKAVKEVVTWAEQRTDTMVLVTADHETGGLQLSKSNGAGKVPEVTWLWGSHTNVDVPIASWGHINTHAFVGRTVENTAIYNVMRGALDAQ